jgi:pSer/pThr/pTyr-binding forkhead associated (FHA) protein
VRIEDLASTNGTYVDGQRIHDSELVPGATLRLGESSWRVEIDPVGSP